MRRATVNPAVLCGKVINGRRLGDERKKRTIAAEQAVIF
jgi:hypothetical protein